MIKVLTLIFMILICQKTFALGVENQLILKILSTSSSKRTILINKGQEEGLKVGDQAKFIKKSGETYALGVVRKTSPSRSLWSIFRLNSTVELFKGNTTRLEIIKPVTITEDSSKLILGEETVKVSTEKIPVASQTSPKGLSSYRDVNSYEKYRNFASLEDRLPEPRSRGVDWSTLDIDEFPYTPKIKYRNVKVKENYSNLQVKPLSTKVLREIPEKFSSLFERGTLKINKEEIEKEYASLEDFDYR